MRKLFFITLALVATVPSFSQLSKKEKRDERKQRVNALIKQEEEGVIAYHKHTAFGFKLTNDGYGGFLEIGRARSVKKVTLFQLDISERKHSKEDKQTNISLPTSPFIFGKIKPTNPSLLACIAIGKAPLILCKPPSNESSPMMKYLSNSSDSI